MVFEQYPKFSTLGLNVLKSYESCFVKQLNMDVKYDFPLKLDAIKADNKRRQRQLR